MSIIQLKRPDDKINLFVSSRIFGFPDFYDLGNSKPFDYFEKETRFSNLLF